MGIAIVWRFAALPGREGAFEKAYGPRGDWARLFAEGDGFLGTTLYRDADGGYLTIDRWARAGDFERFREAHRARYDALDRACETLTASEAPVGSFTEVDP